MTQMVMNSKMMLLTFLYDDFSFAEIIGKCFMIPVQSVITFLIMHL